MSQGIRPYVTTGIALVGASAIAVAPITAPPPEVNATPIATTQRVVTAEVQLASLASLADYTFADAALLTGNAVFVNLPLLAVVLPTTVVIAFASGVGVPELAFLVVNRFVTIPLDLARPWAAALANSLPEPLGGVPVEDSSAPGQGIIFDSFHAVNDAVRGLLVDIFAPNGALAQRSVANAEPEQSWPPDAERVGEVLQLLAEAVPDVPRLVIGDAEEVFAYLAAGRPVDAARSLVSNAIDTSVRAAAIPTILGATFLPQPIGGGWGNTPESERGLLVNGYNQAFDIAKVLTDEIKPDPLPGIVAQKAIEPTVVNELPKDSGNVVDLTLPDPNKKVEDGGNLIMSQGSDLSNGGTVTKSENNRPKVGSNVRAVVKEVRKEMRETVKDFRQGVRDVVKAVTGLGKKEAKQETNNENPTPNP